MTAKKPFRCIIILALLLVRLSACAETAIPLMPGELKLIDLSSGPAILTFTPSAPATYDLCAFPAEGADPEITAELWQNDALIATSTGLNTLLTAALDDTPCTLKLTGAGRVRVELARHALSRCFDDPKPLDPSGDAYAKPIVRPGDVHWYAVTAEKSAPLLLSGLPETPGLALEARLFSPAGRLLAEATQTAGGAFLMDFKPRAGRTYRVRVSAADGNTGLYELAVTPGAGGLPEALLLSEDSLTLQGRETRPLTATAIPEGSTGALLWETSDPQVVSVSQTGVVTGRRPGTAVVTAYAAGAVRARCRVEVRRVPARGVELLTRRIHLCVGDDLALEWRTLPENASDPRVTFEIAPAGVVSADESGVLTALSVGSATITVKTRDGGFEDVGTVYVAPAQKRYRALLIGEQSYAAAARPGSANSVAGMRSMLNELSFLGARYETTTALDLPREGILEAISTAFDGATAQDAALFYITCHGEYAHGMTTFRLYDGGALTALELRQALDKIPGEVVVFLDCCGSGGALGKAASPENILDGISRVFGGNPGPAALATSRYRVLASALVGQDSYRIGFDSNAQEAATATLFARAVCEGCGWSIDRAQRRAMRADANYDDVVTLDELYRYARRRVMWTLNLADPAAAQTVCAWPEGDAKGLFERTVARE